MTACCRKGIGIESGPFIEVKKGTYCCYVWHFTQIVRVGGEGCLGHKTGATHYHAQSGLPDKNRAIKG